MKIDNKQKIFLSMLIIVIFGVSLFFILKNNKEEIAVKIQPSRLPDEGCVWKQFENKSIGFSFLYEYCDLGSRTIDYKQNENKIMQVWKDKDNKEDSYPVIEIFNTNPKETSTDALKRIFISKLDEYSSKHCIVTSSSDIYDREVAIPGVERLTIIPDEEYSKKLGIIEKETTDVLNPPCGDYGFLLDDQSYFEFHKDNPNMFIWVLSGQDTPLFDEQSFRF